MWPCLPSSYHEMPLVELLQQILLSVIVFMFWRQVAIDAVHRRFHLLVACFFTCVFVRELDNWLELWAPRDSVPVASLWILLVTAIASPAIVYALNDWRQLARPMTCFADSRAGTFMVIGLSIVLIFSRVFGSGVLIWGTYLESAPGNLVKTVIQETLELFGYVFITYSSVLYCCYTAVPQTAANHGETAA